MTQDTYRGEQDEPGTFNLYAYCANNPINFIDDRGHSFETIKNSKTIRVYSPVYDAGHIIWRITATIIVCYEKKKQKKTITKMSFYAVGDKHTNCGNGTCRFVNVKLYKGNRLWKTIKGSSNVVVSGDGLYLKTTQICYTDKKIEKKYKVGKNRIKAKAYFYFTPPQEALWRKGKGVSPKVSL